MTITTVAIPDRRKLSEAIEQALIAGDLRGLSPEDRLVYYQAVCESVGVNPLTRPFEYIVLNGKLTLYARRDCTDQLRRLHGVSVDEITAALLGDVYVVTTKGRDRAGRVDGATGAVTITALKGEALANAYMKAETKSKRRLTLSICGLGMLDETEVEIIPGATVGEVPPRTSQITAPPAANGPKANQAQRDAIVALGKRRGLVREDGTLHKTFADHLGREYGIEQLLDLPRAEVNRVLGWLEEQP